MLGSQWMVSCAGSEPSFFLSLPLDSQLALDALNPGCLVLPLSDRILDALSISTDRLDSAAGEAFLDLDPHFKLHGVGVQLHQLHLLPFQNAESLLTLEADAFQDSIDLGTTVSLKSIGQPL